MNLYRLNAFGRPLFFHTDDPPPKKPDDDEGGDKKPVPYAEHVKVRRLLAAAKQDLVTAQGQIKEYEKKAPDVAKIAQERDEAVAARKDLEFRYSADTSLLGLGVTDADDRAFIRDRYASSGEPGKEKPDFGDWIESVQEKRWFKAMLPEQAKGADDGEGGGTPRSDYAAKKATGDDGKGREGDGKGSGADDRSGAGRGTREPEKKAPAFNPNAGTRGNAGANGRPAFTREEIAGMSSSDYKANREAIMDAQRSGRIE